MNIFLVPPHADFTLVWPPPAGFETLDLARSFVSRIYQPAFLSAAIAQAESTTGVSTSEQLFALLQLKAGAALRTTDPARPLQHFRSLAAILAGLSPLPSPVQFLLDDLHLASGTTERSANAVETSLRADVLYQPEINEAVVASQLATSVLILLERDQQLPAVLSLCRALRGKRLRLCGEFATRHRAALARLELLRDCEFDPRPPQPVLAGSPSMASPKPWSWRLGLEHPWPKNAHWAGRVSLTELLDVQTLLSSGCGSAIFAFADLSEQAVDSEGVACSWAELTAATRELRGAGVRVVAEWWIGAPGVTGPQLAASEARLVSDNPFDWMIGFRPFHLPAHRVSGAWGQSSITAQDLPPDRDLARTRPFDSPHTLSPKECGVEIEALARRALDRQALSPGRLAQVYVSTPETETTTEGEIRLDADCALVDLPVALDRSAGPSTYAVNLRTGGVIRLEALILGELRALHDEGRAQVFARFPEPKRTQLINALMKKSILARRTA